MSKPIYYPRLSNIDFGIVRIGGPGLANCMFVGARAYVASQLNKGVMLEPTWQKFSIGPILRKERDKRAYLNLFKSYGRSGVGKMLTLFGAKIGLVKPVIFETNNAAIDFTDLNQHYELVKEYYDKIVHPHQKNNVPELAPHVAIHVRLGDYSASMRVSIEWYKAIVVNLLKVNPTLKFKLYSDGSDEELSELLEMPQVERAFYGSALADIWALSKSSLLIASDSTFSGWGAFLGRVPLLFNRRHFKPVHAGSQIEEVIGESTELPESIVKLVKSM